MSCPFCSLRHWLVIEEHIQATDLMYAELETVTNRLLARLHYQDISVAIWSPGCQGV